MATTKQTPSSKPQPPATPTVESAEAVVSQLAQRREQLVAERTAAVDHTGTYAYDAHVKADEKALAALDEIAATVLRCDTALREIDHAVAEASRQLVIARQAEAAEQDKTDALALRKVVTEIDAAMKYADKHMALAITALNAVNVALGELHKAGSAFPTDMQFAANAERALKTALMQLPRHWWRDFGEHLAPSERRTFSSFWGKMQESLEAGIKQRLGEAERTDVEAA
jgi:hypothetical protein